MRPLRTDEGVGLIGPIHIPQSRGIAIKVMLGHFVILFDDFEGIHTAGIVPLSRHPDKRRGVGRGENVDWPGWKSERGV